jgi:hypothetical protein
MEKCNIHGCKKPAEFEVLHYDVYVHDKHVFLERDFTCPFLYGGHMAENEAHVCGIRATRERVRYPYSNQKGAQGFTIYRPLKDRA